MKKIFYALAVLTLVFPGGVALINLLKEGLNFYWMKYLFPTIGLFLIGVFIPSAPHRKA